MNNLFETVLRFAARRAKDLSLRSSLRAQLVLFGQKEQVREREPPAGQRILVLAPHMDDETFGCGGTLALCARQHSAVTVAYLTDGRKGYDRRNSPHQSDAEGMAFEDRLVAARKEEAGRVSALLRLEPPIFLDLPDGGLAIEGDAIDRVAALLDRVRPGVVFLPFFTDPHRDHWVANGLFLEAAVRSKLPGNLECWGYEVWAPLLANTIVDITSVMDEKDAAMQQYRTQISVCDFRRTFHGLNTYRSMFTQQGKGFAEAFWVGDLDIYRTLYRTTTGSVSP